MEQAAICFENVSAVLGGNEILHSLSLDIMAGEFVTVIGSSGCGKTTLLRLVNGLLAPSGGTVTVHGEDVNHTDQIALRRKIGYAIQSVALFPHMTVEKNIAYVPGLSKKRDKPSIAAKVREFLGLVGLDEELLGRYPSELSGGQRQRVGIARALIASPDILLMDEPFGAVDEITRKALQEEIIRIHQRLGMTVVFVTHDIEEALKLGSRVIVMDAGAIIQDGTSEEILVQPATDFVRLLVNAQPA